MDARLKELFNAELFAQGQPLIDCGDEWTEMIERVDEVRVREGRLAALREVREMVRLKTNELWAAVDFPHDSFAEAACQAAISEVRDVVDSEIASLIAKEEGK